MNDLFQQEAEDTGQVDVYGIVSSDPAALNRHCIHMYPWWDLSRSRHRNDIFHPYLKSQVRNRLYWLDESGEREEDSDQHTILTTD